MSKSKQEGQSMSKHALAHGRGAGNRRKYVSASPETSDYKSHAQNAKMPVQSKHFVAPHFPFQPLPPPFGQPPYRFDLSQLLHQDEADKIAKTKLVFHSVGDTGDERGKEMDFVATMMTQDYDNSPEGEAPAFFYHLGDVVYFAGDIQDYGESFYETYAEYPGLIVSIPGNHDCQPDDPQDGPVDPKKKPLDGWVQNFMSNDPTRLGSLKTTSSRTQMNLPNVYWTSLHPWQLSSACSRMSVKPKLSCTRIKSIGSKAS
jgi:acid phosphatase type 7